MAVVRLSVEPSVLRWARETAGLDVATAAARIGVKRDKVEQWEDGGLAPTIMRLGATNRLYVSDDDEVGLPLFRRLQRLPRGVGQAALFPSWP